MTETSSLVRKNKITILGSVMFSFLSFVIVTLFQFGGYWLLNHYNTTSKQSIEWIDFGSHCFLLLFVFGVFRMKKETINLSQEKLAITIKTIIGIILLGISMKILQDPIFHIRRILELSIPNNSFPENNSIAPSIIPKILNFVILAPLVEELLFRKYIFSGLYNKYGLLVSLLTSSILFSLIHIPKVESISAAFLFGVTAAYLFYRTESLFLCIAFHMIVNLIWLINDIYINSYYQLINYAGYNIGYWSVILGGLVILVGTLKIIIKPIDGSSNQSPQKI